MEENINTRLNTLELKVDKIYNSVEKIRKYFLWILILTVVFFVLPLIATLFMIPVLLNSLSSLYSGLY